MAQVTFTVTFEIETCCNCGIKFAMEAEFQQERRRLRDSFYCPKGHGQHYTAETREEVAKREAQKAQQELQAKLNTEQHASLVAEKKLKEATREAARLSARVAHGVCTCCNRTFADLAEHMKTKHRRRWVVGHSGS